MPVKSFVLKKYHFQKNFMTFIDSHFYGLLAYREVNRITSLQRTLVAHVKAGGRWHSGGGFILRDSDGIHH